MKEGETRMQVMSRLVILAVGSLYLLVLTTGITLGRVILIPVTKWIGGQNAIYV